MTLALLHIYNMLLYAIYDILFEFELFLFSLTHIVLDEATKLNRKTKLKLCTKCCKILHR